MAGVSPKIEARNVSYCCCKTDADCKETCGASPIYRCSLGLCACSNYGPPQKQVAKTNEGTIEEPKLHGPKIEKEQ